MPRSPSNEADRLEAFVHALAGNMRAYGIPMPDLDLRLIRNGLDADGIAFAAAEVVRGVQNRRRKTMH